MRVRARARVRMRIRVKVFTWEKVVPPPGNRIEINQKSDSRENLSPFFNAHVQNTPFWRHIDAILASSPGTFDLKATFSGYESWRFVLKYEKAGGQNCRGNLPGWRIDGDDEMHDSRGDLREDINFIGADRESDFWFISILWPQVQSVDLEIQGRWFSSQPWSCIFRNWPRLGLKMYIFLTLEFTLLYLLATRVNAKYYPYCFFYWALIST